MEKLLSKVFYAYPKVVKRLMQTRDQMKALDAEYVSVRDEYARAKAALTNVFDEDTPSEDEEPAFKRVRRTTK